MPKVADVKLTWNKSASANVAKQTISVTVNGDAQPDTDLPADAQSYMVTVPANTSASFKVTTTDTDGATSVSEPHTFTLGALVAPLPATNLFHAVVAVRDVVAS